MPDQLPGDPQQLQQLLQQLQQNGYLGQQGGFTPRPGFTGQVPVGRGGASGDGAGGGAGLGPDPVAPGAAKPAPGSPEEIRDYYSDPKNRVRKKREHGMTGYYDDSWGTLLDSLTRGDSTGDALTNILRNFKGDPAALEQFLGLATPFLAGSEANSLMNSKGYKYLQDEKNWDMGAMGGYGTAAGMIGQQGRAGMKAGANQLAASGLGRSGAQAALAQQGMMGIGNQQAGLWNQVHQQSMQNRMNSASSAFDAQRQIAQMALGQQITARTDTGGGGGGSSVTGALGSMASGAAGGAAIGGPIGGVIGAAAGGLASLASK